jgi:hypothetical protein
MEAFTMNPKLYNVRRPDTGAIVPVAEDNLDHAVSLGGEVMGEPFDAPISMHTNDSPPYEDVSVQSKPEKIYQVRRPGVEEPVLVAETNLEKAKGLGGQVIGEMPSDEDSPEEAAPENRRNHAQHEYTGENPVASFAKNAAAGFVGGIPDIGVSVHNLASKEENQWPYVTDTISNAIDKATGGYTKDTDPYTKHAAQFLFSLFGGGVAGKAVQAAGAAKKLGAASGAAEKTGKFVANNLGFTNASAKNVSAGLAGGAAIGAAEKTDLPIYAEIPAVIGAFILGGGLGGSAASKMKNSELLKPLFEKIPGLETFLQKQNYQELASKINPDAISDLMKTSLINKEAEFLTQKTLSGLPEEIQGKIKHNPALLNDEEVNLVVEKGMKDFTSQIENLEKEYGISITVGEYTGSPKIVAQEDALANRPHIENFDIATKNRRTKLTQRIEKIQNDLSSTASNTEKLGEKIANEVQSVYSSIKEMRKDNWNKNFGEVSDKNILPIPTYVEKLKEFAKLRPDNLGNEVAIKAAKKKLNDGLQYEKNISPKRVNEILVGMNEDISRFPNETFSRKQMLELKSALEADLTNATENSLTKEQATMVRQARAGYAEDSKLIEEIDQSILFNKVGEETLKVPEKIAKSLDNMPASQLKLTFEALRRSPNHQEVIPQIQRYYIENAMNAATKGGSDTFNPRIFMEKLPKKPELDVILGDSGAYQEIKDLSVLMRRMSKFQPSRSNSKTSQREQAIRNDLEEGVSKVALDAAKGNLSDSILNFIGNQYAKLGNRDKVMSELLLSPEHRKNILIEVGKSEKKRSVMAAFSHAMSQSESRK